MNNNRPFEKVVCTFDFKSMNTAGLIIEGQLPEKGKVYAVRDFDYVSGHYRFTIVGLSIKKKGKNSEFTFALGSLFRILPERKYSNS